MSLCQYVYIVLSCVHLPLTNSSVHDDGKRMHTEMVLKYLCAMCRVCVSVCECVCDSVCIFMYVYMRRWC